MSPFKHILRILSASLLMGGAVVDASTCSGSQSLSLCANWINPFSVNNFTWQTDCGVAMPASGADILMADTVQINTGTW